MDVRRKPKQTARDCTIYITFKNSEEHQKSIRADKAVSKQWNRLNRWIQRQYILHNHKDTVHKDTNLPNEVSSRGGSGVSFSSLTSLSEEKQRRWPCHRVPTRMSRPLSPRGRQRLKAASAPWRWTRDLGSASANIAMEDGIMKVTRVTRVQRECESLPAIN